MSLSIGIVGLPNVGKSTLFNALLKRQAALAANYPFATIEPNTGIVDVPDARLTKLAEFVKTDYGSKAGTREVPERIIPSVIQFYDIAGLVKGASKGEGLGNEFLGHIRGVDAIVQVVRDFQDPNVIRAGAVSPIEDVQTINTELILADIQSLEKRLDKIKKDLRGQKGKEITQKVEIYESLLATLNNSCPASSCDLNSEEIALSADLALLTAKPMMYVLNIGEEGLNNLTTHSVLQSNNQEAVIPICAKLEAELAEFSPEEKAQYLSDAGITQTGLDKVITKGYELLHLESFLTMGPKEVRSWTIHKGTKAPQAAAVIHTDFEKAFIAADVINYDALVKLESWKKAKDVGQIRLEGKEYVMKDGDVVEFRVNA